MKLRALIPLCLSVVASGGSCTPKSPLPLSDSVEVRLLGDAPEAEVRAALVWTLGAPIDRLVVSHDTPVERAQSFRLALEAPPEQALMHAMPELTLSFREQSELIAKVPRVVLYADLNANSRLDTEAPVQADAGESFQGDELLALSRIIGPIPVALPNVKRQLSSISLTEVSQFYETTEQRLTSFVGRGVDGEPVPLSQAPLGLSLNRPEVNQALLWCGKSELTQQTREPDLRAVVAKPLDATALCGLEISDCEAQDFTQVTPPSTESQPSMGISRAAECRRNADLELLIVGTDRSRCEGCSCTIRREFVVHAALISALPEWWPCGSEVPLCESKRSLTALTPRADCDPLSDAGAPQDSGASEAGLPLGDAARPEGGTVP